MNDMDDVQFKAKIDQIMRGVKNIMQKIDELAPEKEQAPEDNQESGQNQNSLDHDGTVIK
jgi:outer membrane murein-binding lipoprotein Lpp